MFNRKVPKFCLQLKFFIGLRVKFFLFSRINFFIIPVIIALMPRSRRSIAAESNLVIARKARKFEKWTEVSTVFCL